MWKDMDGMDIWTDRHIDNKQEVFSKSHVAQVSKYVLTRLNVLSILVSFVSSYNDHDKKI